MRHAKTMKQLKHNIILHITAIISIYSFYTVLQNHILSN